MLMTSAYNSCSEKRLGISFHYLMQLIKFYDLLKSVDKNVKKSLDKLQLS